MNTKFKLFAKIYLLLTLLVQLGFVGQTIWQLGFDRFLFLATTETILVMRPTLFFVSLFISLYLLLIFLMMMPGGLILLNYFQGSEKKEKKHKEEIDSLKKKSDFKF